MTIAMQFIWCFILHKDRNFLLHVGLPPNQENQGKSGNFIFNEGNKGKMRDFVRDNQGTFKFLIVSFQSSDFLHSQPCIQLSVIVAKFYPFVYHSVLCSHFKAQFRFVMKPNI